MLMTKIEMKYCSSRSTNDHLAIALIESCYCIYFEPDSGFERVQYDLKIHLVGVQFKGKNYLIVVQYDLYT